MFKIPWFVFAVLLCLASARAQDDTASNLVFFIDKPLSDNKFVFTDEKNQAIAISDWRKIDTNFYKNFIVAPGEYRIYLPGPVQSVTVNTTGGQPTYLRIEPYRVGDNIVGVQVTSWKGLPDNAITDTLSYLKKNGFDKDIVPTKLQPTGNVIHLVPDNPWTIPPPPK